jgi:hypothetical protein
LLYEEIYLKSNNISEISLKNFIAREVRKIRKNQRIGVTH